jgi:hypothetical protein
MLIALAVLCYLLAFAANIWALVIIFKRSVIGGLLSFFFVLPILYFLVTGWGKEGEDIKKPFFLSFLFAGIGVALMFSMVGGAALDMQKQIDQQMQAPSARPGPSFREPAPAAESSRVRDTAPAPQPVSAPQRPAAPANPAYRTEAPKPVQQAPSRPGPAQSNCVYKPVMTDEDLAKCR